MVTSTLPASLNTLLSLRSTRLQENEPPPAPEPPPEPTPEPEPQPEPQPGIDFSNMDCPTKAALLPSLNVAIAGMVVAGAIGAAMSGAPFAGTVHMMAGDTCCNLEYSIDPQSLAISAHGTLGETPFCETWSMQGENQLVIRGTIGDACEELTFTAGENSATLTGHIGDMEINQNMFVVEGSNPRLVVDGTLGGLAFHQEISAPEAPEGEETMSLNVAGYLGTQDISTTGQALPSENESSLNMNAEGNVAGIGITVEGSIGPKTEG